jgi:hypothetical protein
MGLRKYFVGGFLILGLLVAGFIFLIRGCLSKFDERAAIVPVLYIERDGKAVLFSLVKFEKTTSYSQKGGFTSKSVSTSYFIQSNDPQTGARIAEQKIKHHDDIRHYPVETLGSGNGLAWVFMGELMAFDPFSLEKKADKEIIESKNPALKGKLPDERRYYLFNTSDKSITITANDGTFWKLNTGTLLVAPQDEPEPRSTMEAAMKRIEKLQEQNRKAQDSLYQHDHPSKLYAAGKITQNQYAKFQEKFFARRDSLYAERDSLQNLVSLVRKKESNIRQLHSTIESLQRGNNSYQQIKSNQDTVDAHWWGLYSKTEFEKLYGQVRMEPEYDETARRQLYQATYIEESDGDCRIKKEEATLVSPEMFFLQGGFLLDKQTALPVRLQNSHAKLVVHKDKIGNEGKILLTRIDQPGKVPWTIKTNLKEWTDWVIAGNRLYIFGADNPALSSNDCNVLFCVDLNNGNTSRYDYFTNK